MLEHVLWIGGSAGAGKTTVATRLARRHGLRWYGADTRTWDHRDRAVRAGNEAALRWEALSPAERWAAPPEELLAMSLNRERRPMVLDDVAALPPSPLIVAEGTVVPASAAAPGRAVWLLTTPGFRNRIADARRWPSGPRSLNELVAADVEREARERGVPVLEMDATRGIGDTVAAVEALLADALAHGPCVAGAAARRALLREANLSLVAQLRGYHARPWANGEGDATEREFLCECGDRGCVEWVSTSVAATASLPVLAHGHTAA